MSRKMVNKGFSPTPPIPNLILFLLLLLLLLPYGIPYAIPYRYPMPYPLKKRPHFTGKI